MRPRPFGRRAPALTFPRCALGARAAPANELLARQYSHVFLVYALIRFAAGRYGGSNATLRSLAVASYLTEIAFAAAEVFVYKTNPLNYFVGAAAICTPCHAHPLRPYGT